MDETTFWLMIAAMFMMGVSQFLSGRSIDRLVDDRNAILDMVVDLATDAGWSVVDDGKTVEIIKPQADKA